MSAISYIEDQLRRSYDNHSYDNYYKQTSSSTIEAFFNHVAQPFLPLNKLFIISFAVVMENMASETGYLFQKAGVIDPLATMNAVRNRTIRPVEVKNRSISYTDYWRNVSQAVIDKVRFYYRYELWLYGYPETPFYISPD